MRMYNIYIFKIVWLWVFELFSFVYFFVDEFFFCGEWFIDMEFQ